MEFESSLELNGSKSVVSQPTLLVTTLELPLFLDLRRRLKVLPAIKEQARKEVARANSRRVGRRWRLGRGCGAVVELMG
jgi:hypothetical protein